MRKSVHASIREEWSFEHEGATLKMGTHCDRLGPTAETIHEVIVQRGAGHGGTLDLTRLSKRDDGDWDVIMLRASDGYFAAPQDPGGDVLRGTLPKKPVQRAIDAARTAMAVAPREIQPDPLPFGGSFSSSSADFHSFVRVIDSRGRSRELAFTGYMGSSDQEVWIPAMLAEQAFREIADPDDLDPTDVDDESRRFFMERFIEASANDYYGEYGWWVRERLVGMAGIHASLDIVPSLAQQLCKGGPDASDGRTRADALESIFDLLGSEEELTRDDHGWIDESLALDWARACGTSCAED
jgi:hypothetical protein